MRKLYGHCLQKKGCWETWIRLVSPHHVGTYVQMKRPFQSQFFSIPQAASLCTGPLLEVCVPGIRQTQSPLPWTKHCSLSHTKPKAMHGIPIPEAWPVPAGPSLSLHWASAGLGPELSPSKAGDIPPSAPYIGVNLKEWLGLGTGSTSGLQGPSACFPLILRNTENSRFSECVVCAPTKGPLKAGPSLPLLHSPHRRATNVVN